MAERNTWTWKGDTLECENLDLYIDLTEWFEHWGELNWGEKFTAQYGVKQWIASGLAGVDKADLKEAAKLMKNRGMSHDFARKSGGGGVTKAELKAERDRLAQSNADLEAQVKKLQEQLAKAKSK